MTEEKAIPENTIKPCPFCGSTAELEYEYEEYCVICTNRTCYGEGAMRSTKEGAIIAWNRRADSRAVELPSDLRFLRFHADKTMELLYRAYKRPQPDVKLCVTQTPEQEATAQEVADFWL